MKRNFEEILEGINSKHYSDQNASNTKSLKSFIGNKLVGEIPLEKKKLKSKDPSSNKKILRGFTLGISDLSGESIDKRVALLLPSSSADYGSIKESIINQIESEGYAFLSVSLGGLPKVLSKREMSLYCDVSFDAAQSLDEKPISPNELSKKSGFRPKRS